MPKNCGAHCNNNIAVNDLLLESASVVLEIAADASLTAAKKKNSAAFR
jgi:hypothetical protein